MVQRRGFRPCNNPCNQYRSMPADCACPPEDRSSYDMATLPPNGRSVAQGPGKLRVVTHG